MFKILMVPTDLVYVWIIKLESCVEWYIIKSYITMYLKIQISFTDSDFDGSNLIFVI